MLDSNAFGRAFLFCFLPIIVKKMTLKREGATLAASASPSTSLAERALERRSDQGESISTTKRVLIC